MESGESANRWWENYLVRYFMPSIAGIVIVSWLANVAGDDTKRLLFFDLLGDAHDTASLILLVLYGNLFCYVASYPILGFHATRVIDFPNASWKPRYFDGYLTSAATFVAAIAGSDLLSSNWLSTGAFCLVVCFSALQFWRMWLALQTQTVRGLIGQPSLAYGYAYSLARRRGIKEDISINLVADTDVEVWEEGGENGRENEITKKRQVSWRREIIESYRHLREHGNSAYIFFLEIVLCVLCYMVIADTKFEPSAKLSHLGILLVLWGLPAILSHLLGECLERRFSLFDERLKK